MQVLITLKVKYGYPISALLGFIKNEDYRIWEIFLKDLSYQISICEQEGHIYLIGNCSDVSQFQNELYSLPLLQEEFLTITIHQFSDFKTLDPLFRNENHRYVQHF